MVMACACLGNILYTSMRLDANASPFAKLNPNPATESQALRLVVPFDSTFDQFQRACNFLFNLD